MAIALQSKSRTAVHAAGLCSFSFSFWLLTQLTNKADNAFGWHFMYLTIIGLGLSAMVYFLALLHDIRPHPGIDHAKQLCLVVAYPIEALITILYWSIVLYDDHLMHGDDQERLPFLLDATYHLFPAIALWIEFLAFSDNFKRSIKHIYVIYSFALLYGIWLQVCYYYNGFWPYPFFHLMEHHHRVAVYLSSATLCSFIYMTGATVHTRLHLAKQHLLHQVKQSDKLL
ncbi:FAR-17a/AIG1-like protein [Syncephalis pseudoplumigaleata]|uniref:FAR-17a/AIG1-like protein n=1 Tax=Syncephalis pseudoplumigaleata TaxID=1712513 RepID=A0A4P9YYX0_9FUNG|nr:FAR-17a/AIG1-like protein [Syncephalis pseudoplumigaleata]|eukprot:RKP25317.1 FAR-17a/AIG1-like protein [Syncephalis pseudoplumigaleata]